MDIKLERMIPLFYFALCVAGCVLLLKAGLFMDRPYGDDVEEYGAGDQEEAKSLPKKRKKSKRKRATA
jgi:hypothetical protein